WAIRFVVRFRVGVAERLLVAAGAIAASALVYLATGTLAAGTSDPETRRLVHLCGVAAIALLVVVGRRWLVAGAERLLVHRSRLRRTALQDSLQAVSPDAGVGECCRRALPGGAPMFGREGAAVL